MAEEQKQEPQPQPQPKKKNIAGHFVAHRLLDLLLPGVGVLVDALTAAEMVEIAEAVEAVNELAENAPPEVVAAHEAVKIAQAAKNVAQFAAAVSKIGLRDAKFELNEQQALDLLWVALNQDNISATDYSDLVQVAKQNHGISSTEIVPKLRGGNEANRLITTTYRGEHGWVVCDVCRHDVKGKRFKFIRQNYDLCENCFKRCEQPQNFRRYHTRVHCNGCGKNPIKGLCYSHVSGNNDFCEDCWREGANNNRIPDRDQYVLL